MAASPPPARTTLIVTTGTSVPKAASNWPDTSNRCMACGMLCKYTCSCPTKNASAEMRSATSASARQPAGILKTLCASVAEPNQSASAPSKPITTYRSRPNVTTWFAWAVSPRA